MRNNNESLKDKNILYIGLDYFRIPKAICEELYALGVKKVDFFPIKQRNLFLSLSKYISKRFYNKCLDSYHKSILNKSLGEKYDFIFFIQVHFFHFETLKEFKKSFPQSKFILYNWDSLAQHNYLPHVEYFDKTYTFDSNDANEHDKLTYLPLFFTKEFENISALKLSNKPSVLFFGTYNKHIRYEYVKRISEFLKENNIEFHNHLSTTWTRFLRELFLSFRLLNLKYIRIRPLPLIQIIKLYQQVDLVIDIPNNTQSGLTMRTIETLGSGRYLITTNKNITREKFFDEEKVFILEENNYDKMLEFIKKPKRHYKLEHIADYSLNAFLVRVFSI